MLASVPAATFVLLSIVPWMSDCWESYDDPSPELDACQREEQEQDARGRTASLITGLSLAAVGMGLTIHGGIRIRRTKAERRAALARLRPASWSVQTLPQRTSATVAWSF